MSSLTITSLFIFASCFLNIVAADSYVYGYSFGGAGGLIILILDIIAIVDVLRSSRSVLGKLLWVLLILLFPLGGLIIWCIFGRKTAEVV